MTKLKLVKKIICYVGEKYCPLDQFQVGLQSKHTNPFGAS